jgi:hypothetical protein
MFAMCVIFSFSIESAYAITIPYTAVSYFGDWGWKLYAVILMSFGVTAVIGAIVMVTSFASIGFEGMFAIGFAVTLLGLINIATFDQDARYNYVEGYRKE